MEINFELTPFGWYAEIYRLGRREYTTPDQGNDPEPTYFPSFLACAEDANKAKESLRANLLKKVVSKV